MHLAMWPTPCTTGQVHLLVYIYIYIYYIYKLLHMHHSSNTNRHFFFFHCIPRLWNSIPVIDLTLSVTTIKIKLADLFGAILYRILM